MNHSTARTELQREAEFIHRALFRRPMPPQVGERYAAAHQHFCSDPQSWQTMQTIVRKGLDLEAVEMALRRRDPGVTRKIQILLYAVEVLPDYQNDILNDRDRPVSSWFRLAWETLRSGWKGIKGRFVALRHGLV